MFWKKKEPQVDRKLVNERRVMKKYMATKEEMDFIDKSETMLSTVNTSINELSSKLTSNTEPTGIKISIDNMLEMKFNILTSVKKFWREYQLSHRDTLPEGYDKINLNLETGYIEVYKMVSKYVDIQP